MTRCLSALALAALLLAPARADTPAVATERHYEILRNGQKVGYCSVTWAPSTWQGKRTVHDTTTIVRRSVRNMMGVKDTFSTTTTIDLERDEDGTLWWQRIRVDEGARVLVEEATWTGAGYEHVSTVDGVEHKRVSIALDAPVMADSEAFIGPRVRRGEVKPGDALELRELDVRAQGAHVTRLVVLPPEEVEGEAGKVRCTPVRQEDPGSGSELVLWIDADGAFVQLRDDQGNHYRRATRAAAEEMPVKPAEYPVTTPSTPTVERIFTAARVTVDVHLQGDPHRKLPDLPASPWSRAGEARGSDEAGWVIPVELSAYDDLAAKATFDDVDRAAFARDLEPTVLMPCDHPDLVRTAKQVVGDAVTLREAAHRLVRWVYTRLQKQSPDVADATALEILRDMQGDCSEHCVLFVALCRAAGIPARRCSGYVCLGTQWGAHAWAEIWVGAWVSADPTTGEIGGGARYLFFGYQDRPDSYPGVVSSRITGRIRLVTTSLTAPEAEGGATYDLTDPKAHRVADAAAGRYVNALAGIVAHEVPDGWTVRHSGAAGLLLQGPGLYCSLSVMADQGADLAMWGGGNGSFCGVPARVSAYGKRRSIIVHSRRRIVQVSVAEATDEAYEALQRVLAPTFGGAP
ncbi:MAG: transglutaminase-like domain-containing protein [Planctomycetes bacterium]|nr:transglutaminase-like domain-containing protein [Planctomycetota bacterium]